MNSPVPLGSRHSGHRRPWSTASISLAMLGVLLIGFVHCTTPATTSTLKIAAAANTQFAMETIVEQFIVASGISCELITSSSGKLTAQIKEGAPFDVFISADLRYPEALQADGQTLGELVTYALGGLALWSRRDRAPLALDSLSSGRIKYIAVANPKTAPYGSAALEVLRAHADYDDIRDKLVFGESISQVNQFIHSGTADVGFTAESVVRSPVMRGVGRFVPIDQALHTPIVQGAAVLRSTRDAASAQQFLDFLGSAEVRQILVDHGYEIP